MGSTGSYGMRVFGSLRERFGTFPLFWQDLLTWEYTR
jgi:hypothetical protein